MTDSDRANENYDMEYLSVSILNQVRRAACTYCRQPGHYSKTCPAIRETEKDGLEADILLCSSDDDNVSDQSPFINELLESNVYDLPSEFQFF